MVSTIDLWTISFGNYSYIQIGTRTGFSGRLPWLDASKMGKPFDLLAEFGKFGLERRMSLRDPVTISAFIGHVGDRVEGALGDSPLLYGQRTEAMFEAFLVSLGEFELLKGEDSGRLFPDVRYRVPDFRVVLKDGSHWLIEVKNVYEPDPLQQRRRVFSASHLGQLTAYADATGAELKIAVFWARWRIWTLVSPDRLIEEDGGLNLDMLTALRVNELSSLGDRTIGTRPPLRLRLTMDQARTGPVDADGQVVFSIRANLDYTVITHTHYIQCFSLDAGEGRRRRIEEAICGLIVLKTETGGTHRAGVIKRVSCAWIFMFTPYEYGEWRSDKPEAILDGPNPLND